MTIPGWLLHIFAGTQKLLGDTCKPPVSKLVIMDFLDERRRHVLKSCKRFGPEDREISLRPKVCQKAKPEVNLEGHGKSLGQRERCVLC